jgi:hypothetical protein
MGKVIVWTRPDGGLSVFHVAPKSRRQGETLAQWINRLIAKVVPADATGVRMDDDTALPSRRFRECWRSVAGTVAIHLASARLQVLAELRRERNARLARSDGEKARLDEIGTAEQKESLRAYRQALRDLPVAVAAEVEAIADAAALEAYQPTWPVEPVG